MALTTASAAAAFDVANATAQLKALEPSLVDVGFSLAKFLPLRLTCAPYNGLYREAPPERGRYIKG